MNRTERLRAAFSPGRVRYHNFPVACRRQDYERAVERYLDIVRRVPGVVGVGRYGNISSPGISDLDMVVITEDDLPAGSGEKLSIGQLPEFERNLFMHEAAIMPTQGMAHVSQHLDVASIETVWGAVPPIPSSDEAERKWHETAILMEWLGCFCRFFGEIASEGVSNVRWALPVLHSLRYTAALAGSLVPDAPAAWSRFPERVAALRAGWFDIASEAERAERLGVCLAEGWEVTADLCCRIERWIEAERLLPSVQANSGWSAYSYEATRFAIVARCQSPEAMIDSLLNIAGPDRNDLPERWQGLSKRLTPSWCLLPRFHEAFTMAAAATAPTVYSHASRQWFGGQRVTPMRPESPFEEYLCVRMERLERQARYLKRNGLEFGSACSDLVYAPPSGDAELESWRRRLLLSAQKTWGAGRIRAAAQSAGSKYSFC